MRKRNGIKEILSELWCLLFMLLMLALAMGMVYFEAAENEYFRLEGIAVKVTAEVTKMYETTDEDDDTVYKMYITYSYNGVTQKDVYYKTTGNRNLYGKTVTVEIDPVHPRRLRPEMDIMLALRIALVLLFLAFFLWMPLGYARGLGERVTSRSWKKIYNSPILSVETIRRDLEECRRRAHGYSVGSFCLLTAVLVASSVCFYFEYRAFTVVPMYAIAFAIAIWGIRALQISSYELQIWPVTLESVETDKESKDVIWHFDRADWKLDKSIFVTRTGCSLEDCAPGRKFYIARQSWLSATGEEKNAIVRLYDAGEFRTL